MNKPLNKIASRMIAVTRAKKGTLRAQSVAALDALPRPKKPPGPVNFEASRGAPGEVEARKILNAEPILYTTSLRRHRRERESTEDLSRDETRPAWLGSTSAEWTHFGSDENE